MIFLLFVTAFAILNRARGTRLFNKTSSTEIGRLVSMAGMTFLTLFLLPQKDFTLVTVSAGGLLALFLCWCSFAWDAYWSAAIGNDPLHSRLWGLRAMTYRMALAAPVIILVALLAEKPVNAVFGAGFLLMGLPYYIAGYARKWFPSVVVNPIAPAEFSVGAILGALIWMAGTF